MKKNNDLGLLILRITLGILMLLHGISKLSGGLEFIQSMLMEKGIPGFIGYGVLIGEVLAPLAIIVGYRTRIASIIFAINCLVAITLVHLNDLFTISKHGGWAVELIGLYLFVAVALFFTVAGKYAVSSHNNWD